MHAAICPYSSLKISSERTVLLQLALKTLLFPGQGFRADQISAERFLNLRYSGTDVAVMTACSRGDDVAAVFETAYK